MERDRLKRKLKKKAIRNTLLILGGLIAFGVIIFMFGTQLLIQFSLLLTKDGSVTPNETQEVSYIAPPDLDPVADATNSAKMKITGTSTVENAVIKLYINGSLTDSVNVNSKNEFEFKSVILEEGSNEIKAKTEVDGKLSDYSSSLNIVYQNEPPDLSIEYPADGQTLKNDNQTITGKTVAGASVTVNGFRAIVQPNGNFTYNIKLQNGGNNIKIVTTDTAGNKTEKEINVTFSP